MTLEFEQCWSAIEAGDSKFDGRFFYGVISTGVYCRPSCPSRMPLRKNVRFYETAVEAEQDGLRACRRCRPRSLTQRDRVARIIRDVCKYIENSEEPRHSLQSLADRAGMSVFHFQRSFKKMVGVTPGQYMEAHRMARLKASLRTS
jgi:AraC family transcriptional regulator of adaptative response/methylated-DNA-[protein]-cysteine methyltransferase